MIVGTILPQYQNQTSMSDLNVLQWMKAGKPFPKDYKYSPLMKPINDFKIITLTKLSKQ